VRERIAAAAVVGVVAIGAGIWGVVSTQTGCELQGSCDTTLVYVPALPPGVTAAPGIAGQPFQPDAGLFTDGFGATFWQSSPIEGTWMNFPGQRTYLIYPQLPDGGAMVGPFLFESVQVSADPNPYASPSNFAPSAGNITEFSGLPDGGMTGFSVTNNTCSPYYLWLQVAPEYPAPAPADAGTD
jgi:hypothetical protein